MEVKIQKLRPGAVTPKRGSADAAGYDLYACPADGQSVTIAPHATAMIGTGLALAIPDEPRTVAPGDRIAQLVILPFLAAEFSETDALDATDRGAGGFGSTGR
mgnify:CR=1 FL=1